MFKRAFYFLFILLFLFSCSKEKEPVDFINKNSEEFVFRSNDSTNISPDIAIEIANQFKYKTEFFNEGNKLKSGSQYEFKDVIIIPDENEEPAIYVVNFSPQGYVIISATAKETPILGFSDESSFDIENVPLGMADWFYDRMHKIQVIRKNGNYKIPNEVISKWGNFSIDGNLKLSSKLKTSVLEERVEQYGPLLTSLWEQGEPYNDLLPKIGCSYNNRRAPAGCLPIAIAQVLRYHAFPSTKYNWDIMPDISWDGETLGSIEVAKLIQDVGSYVGVNYGCDGTGGAPTSNAVSVFKDNFNYSSGGTFARLSFEEAEPLVKADIKANRPMIMEGYNGRHEHGWWIFKSTHYTEGHAWVCDGYKRIYYVPLWGDIPPIDLPNISDSDSGTHYYHMNWGYSISGQMQNNGWFLINNIQLNHSSDYNFQYNRGYLTNIIP